MHWNHWIAGVALGLFGTCCLAEQPPAGPELGPAEVIGSLQSTEAGAIQLGIKLVSLPGEVDSIYFEESDDPQLGEPVLLASLEEPVSAVTELSPWNSATTSFGDTPSAMPPAVTKDPGEIQQQLNRTVQLLESAGLTGESQAVEAIQRDFEANLTRLTLEWKRAELAKLQAEIDELVSKLNHPINLSIEIIEADDEVIQQLATETNNPLTSMQIVDTGVCEKILGDNRSSGKVRTLIKPDSTTCTGQTAKATLKLLETATKPHIRAEANPSRIEGNRIRLSYNLQVQLQDSGSSWGGAIELANGQTFVVSKISADNTANKALVVVITPTLTGTEVEDEESVVLPVYFTLPPAPIPVIEAELAPEK